MKTQGWAAVRVGLCLVLGAVVACGDDGPDGRPVDAGALCAAETARGGRPPRGSTQAHPEESLLYRTVQEHWRTFEAEIAASGGADSLRPTLIAAFWRR